MLFCFIFLWSDGGTGEAGITGKDGRKRRGRDLNPCVPHGTPALKAGALVHSATSAARCQCFLFFQAYFRILLDLPKPHAAHRRS